MQRTRKSRDVPALLRAQNENPAQTLFGGKLLSVVF